MRLTQLRLENFKIFKKAKIEFRPLTLLTGTNSSGKSTILNAITTIIQTEPPHLFPFEFIPYGKSCSLGSFRDIAHGKNARTKFSIGITLERAQNQVSIDARYRFSASGNQILPDSIVYKSESGGLELTWQGQDKGYKATIHGEEYNEMISKEWVHDFKSILTAMIKDSADIPEDNRDKAVEEFQAYFIKQKEKSFSIKSGNSLEILSGVRKQPAGNFLLNRLSEILTQLGSAFVYIGPIRAFPSRYYMTEDSGQKVDPAGKNAIQLLYEWKKYSRKRYSEVVKLVQLLELASKVEAKSSMDEILKFNIQPFQHDERVSLADVGFGLSQILPILVADVALPNGGTLLVNQPEVHLHPSSQALLGNYFASRLKNRRYVIETHSEYLLNRLRLLATEGKLDVNDVSIIFVESTSSIETGPKIHNITIGKDGSLTNAPKSFFDTYYLDTFNIAMGGFEDHG